MTGDDPGAAGRWLPQAGVVVGAVATLPPFLGPALDTAQRVEVADHLVPGLVVVGVSLAALATKRADRLSGTSLLLAGLCIFLAGLWMAATHVPLIAQAGRGEAPWGATVYHSASAAIVLAFGLLWARLSWAAAA